jgi:hypothetical protein
MAHIDCSPASAEELQAPLLMALESALDTATADDKTDAAYVAGALAAVQTLCATQVITSFARDCILSVGLGARRWQSLPPPNSKNDPR